MATRESPGRGLGGYLADMTALISHDFFQPKQDIQAKNRNGPPSLYALRSSYIGGGFLDLNSYFALIGKRAS